MDEAVIWHKMALILEVISEGIKKVHGMQLLVANHRKGCEEMARQRKI
ncbi:hypothetical protein IV487_01835 [Enterococcus saccharolyticus]|nr:hypothetical protein [Enterococcus saccharolyticus]MCD5001204.1 hypothetical protein [Enterococcus saccharolyticus]